MTFDELAMKVLTETKIPMTPKEIWDYAKEKRYDKTLSSRGKTPWDTIASRLYVSVRDDPDTKFGKTTTRPARFYVREFFTGGIDISTLADKRIVKQPKPVDLGFSEKDLHPFLTYFAYNNQKSFTKTIHHAKSRKDSYGEWVHPDMVGCFYTSSDWAEEVLELSRALKDQLANPTIISYELKKEINMSNLREVFFQAVSNSSWANQSYLAAARISDDQDFFSELQRLSAAFDIGVIHLDTEDPDSSEIVLSANYKDDLDWETINKLSSMNSDFRSFVKRIIKDFSNNEIKKEDYDKILTREELISSIKSKRKTQA